MRRLILGPALAALLAAPTMAQEQGGRLDVVMTLYARLVGDWAGQRLSQVGDAL